MPLIDPERSLLLLIDLQARLMPAIHEAEAALRNAGRLLEAARMLGVPGLLTEQNPKGLGPTVEQLPTGDALVVAKQSFGACGEDGFADRIPSAAQVIVAGWEAHVCVLQTVLGLLDGGRKVHVVCDATEPPRVYRRVSGSMIRLLLGQRSSLRRISPLLRLG